MKKEKGKITRKQKSSIIIGSVVLLLVLVAIFSDILFPNSQFSLIISNTIGKFFNIAKFFSDYYVTILESLVIVFFIWVLNKVISLSVAVFIKKGGKAQMVAELIKSTIKYVMFIVGLFLILNAWGVETQTLLAGAGIIALAISFGAQSLIEDIISGFFIMFEKQFAIGDVIQVGDFRGTVVSTGIRVTKLEDINGDIKIMNNSDIRGAINTSDHLSPAICNISISYKEDIKRVENIILQNLASIKSKIPAIKEGPIYRGVQSLGDSGVVVQIYARTEELKRYQAIRDLNREMKILFDENHIEIPFQQVVVHMEEKQQDKK